METALLHSQISNTLLWEGEYDDDGDGDGDVEADMEFVLDAWILSV